MKFIISTILILLIVYTAPAQNTWTTLPNYIGTPRMSAAMFIINNTVFVGTGRDSIVNPGGGNLFTNDFYKFNPATNSWSSIANLPGESRWLSTYFSLGNKGYVICGAGDSIFVLKEVWEYDPIADSWNQKNNFPGDSRYAAYSFIINNKAYIGGGYPGNKEDLWEYNQTSDTWIQKANCPASGRHSAIAFAINNKGYMGLGRSDTVVSLDDFWEYTPLIDSWTQKAAFPDSGRNLATGFSLNGRGYAGLGATAVPTGTVFQKDFWEYNPILDSWQSIPDIPGIPRSHCVAASNDSFAYIFGGHDGFLILDDFYSLSVTTSIDNSGLHLSNKVVVYSNNKIITIINKLNKSIRFEAYDIHGKILLSSSVITKKKEIDASNIIDEIVFYRIYSERNIIKTGKLSLVE